MYNDYMKISKLNALGLLSVGSILGIVAYLTPITASASTCVQINSDLSYGQTDSTYGGSISILQNYLQSLGYLSATPNGHFGPSTLLAVKAYQTANSISNTGYAGPLTRASISQKTCSASPATTVNTPTILQPAPTPTPVAEVINTNVTSPATGQVLSVGSSTVIRWNNSPSGIYNISLEQPGGSGAGFIALNQSSNTINPNQYVWSVGKVSTPQSNSAIVSPGTYRIRLQSSVSGASTNDQTSGWFTIVAQQFAVSSVVPSSAYADNATSVVLFGTGFTNSTIIYFDSNYSGLRANNQYVSSDGTILVFTVPTNVSSGSHTLYINSNGYNSLPVTVPFTVLSTQ